MLNSGRNRGRFGGQECQYGCCRTMDGPKAQVRRQLKRREAISWKKDVSEQT